MDGQMIDDGWGDGWGESRADEGVLCGKSWASGGGQEEQPHEAHSSHSQGKPGCGRPGATSGLGCGGHFASQNLELKGS